MTSHCFAWLVNSGKIRPQIDQKTLTLLNRNSMEKLIGSTQ